MDTIDFIKEVETTYDVSSIKVNNIQIWPFLRTEYICAYFYKCFLKISEQEFFPIPNRIDKLKDSFYGFRNLFKKHDYMVFTNKRELRLKNGVYVNIHAEVLFDLLGKERTLLVEHPNNSSRLDLSELSMKNILSVYLFSLLSFFNPFPLKINIKNEYVLKEINKKYNLNIDYKKKIRRFESYKSLFIILFKIKKPKLIFLTAYFSLINQAIINAARTLGIKTIELQHGIISNAHHYYNVYANIDKNFFPEYLFVFGNNTKDIFNHDNYFIDKKNIFPVGNMYLEFINNYQSPPNINSIFYKYKSKYKRIMAVSSQSIIEEELIDFLKKSASLSTDCLFIFIPRDTSKDYSAYNLSENIVVIKNLDVYQTIKYSDFHATVYSTCALEAPVLGIPNILINIKNESKKHYSKILTNPEVTKFVDTPEEFVKLIQTWTPKSKEEIRRLHEGFYAKDHKEKLKRALDKIMNDNNIRSAMS